MLWHKAWIDTRWRFLIGLGILICVVLANVLAYSSFPGFVADALAGASQRSLAGEVAWVAQLSGSFRGFVWVQVIRQNLCGLWIIFAVLLGADGLLSRRTGTIFTLALPVSRRQLFTVRAAADLAELFLLALIPLLLIPLTAPAVGHTYRLADALAHGISIFVAGTVFYGLPRLLAAVFDDRWRPIVITLAVAILVQLCKDFFPTLAPFNPAVVMDGERYFITGAPAWAGLVTWFALSMALLYAALRFTEKRDF